MKDLPNIAMYRIEKNTLYFLETQTETWHKLLKRYPSMSISLSSKTSPAVSHSYARTEISP